MPHAYLLPNGEQTFLDNNGEPLSGGFVFMYVPGTTVDKTTWLDPNETTANTNPINLDASGRAIIYGAGQYRQLVTDSASNLIWDQLTEFPVIGTLAAQDADAVNITGGTITGVTLSSPNATITGGAISQTSLSSNNVNFTGGTIGAGVAISGVWNNQQNVINATYTVQPTDNGKTLVLLGLFYQVSFNAAGAYAANFFCVLTNPSGRGKLIGLNGTTFMLWPNQTVQVVSWQSASFQVMGYGRWVLGGTTVFFVSPGNLNFNDGLGSDAPMDLQTALNVITRGGFQLGSAGIDCNNHSVLISALPGTYSGEFDIFGGQIGGDVFTLQSQTGNASDVQIVSFSNQTAIFVRDGGRIQLTNVEVACGAGGSAIRVSQSGIVDLSGVVFGSCDGGNMVNTQAGGGVNFVGPCSIAGNAVQFIYTQQGDVDLGGQAINFAAPVNISMLIEIVGGSVQSLAGSAIFTNPGNLTGTSYLVAANGVLNRNGTVIPGATGTIATGGQVL